MAFIDDLMTGTGRTDNGASTNLSSLNSVVDFLFLLAPLETFLKKLS